MSPVPTELNESSQLIEQSMLDEPSIQTSGYLAGGSQCGMVVGLRDNVNSRFTIVRHFRIHCITVISSCNRTDTSHASCHEDFRFLFNQPAPSGFQVVRIDPLRFLAGCHLGGPSGPTRYISYSYGMI